MYTVRTNCFNSYIKKITPTLCLNTFLCGWLGFSSLSAGQENISDLAVVETDMINEAIPPNLAGHEKGDRLRKEEVNISGGGNDEEAGVSEWFGGESWWNWSRATGDWGGFRNDLDDFGLIFEGSYTGEWSGVWDGGINQHATYRHFLDLNLTADFELLFDIVGGSLFVDYYSTSGSNLSTDSGDIQGSSNIEVDPDVDELAELWYEQWLFENRLRLKVGKVEANSEFAFVEVGGDFISSSPGMSPTIFVLPTCPDPAMSVNVFVYPTENLYFGLGVYDGAMGVDGIATGRRGPRTFFSDHLSDDYFWIGEAGYSWENLTASMGDGRLAVGAWYHSGIFTQFDGNTENGTEGFYVLFEQQIWSENPDIEDDDQGMNFMIQYGYADEDVSEVAHHLGAGLIAVGPLAGRDNDSAGLYVSFVDLSDANGAGFTDDETALELYYKYQLTPYASIKPDIQYIINPSGDSNVDDVLIGMLRFEVTF